jgi:hypothetical protein
MQDHMTRDLNLKPYYPKCANELSDIDGNQHNDACRGLLDTFLNTKSCSRVVFTSECTIYFSTHERNVVF